jgi:predicted GH43/DUF377 family glycosyl hydrolase
MSKHALAVRVHSYNRTTGNIYDVLPSLIAFTYSPNGDRNFTKITKKDIILAPTLPHQLEGVEDPRVVVHQDVFSKKLK